MGMECHMAEARKARSYVMNDRESRAICLQVECLCTVQPRDNEKGWVGWSRFLATSGCEARASSRTLSSVFMSVGVEVTATMPMVKWCGQF